MSECKLCGSDDLPWAWPVIDLCDQCAKPNVIAKPNRGKAHAVFGYTAEGLQRTYCGLRWDGRASEASPKQKHCKHCTKELRKAQMSWEFYHGQDREVRNILKGKNL